MTPRRRISKLILMAVLVEIAGIIVPLSFGLPHRFPAALLAFLLLYLTLAAVARSRRAAAERARWSEQHLAGQARAFQASLQRPVETWQAQYGRHGRSS
jgi:hypothetical protein